MNQKHTIGLLVRVLSFVNTFFFFFLICTDLEWTGSKNKSICYPSGTCRTREQFQFIQSDEIPKFSQKHGASNYAQPLQRLSTTFIYTLVYSFQAERIKFWFEISYFCQHINFRSRKLKKFSYLQWIKKMGLRINLSETSTLLHET